MFLIDQSTNIPKRLVKQDANQHPRSPRIGRRLHSEVAWIVRGDLHLGVYWGAQGCHLQHGRLAFSTHFFAEQCHVTQGGTGTDSWRFCGACAATQRGAA